MNNVYHINAHSVAYKSMKQQSLIANRRYVVDRRVISIAALNKYVPTIVKNFLGCKSCEMRRVVFSFFLFCLKFKTRGYVNSSIGVLLNIVEQETKDRLALERYI